MTYLIERVKMKKQIVPSVSMRVVKGSEWIM